ncbi:MAG: hypothetical protein ACYC4S_14030 [Rhodoferax sp.]
MPAFVYWTAEYLRGPVAAANPQDRVVIFSDADEAMESKQAVSTALLAVIAQLRCATPAERCGINPEQHPSLRKVTQTH